MLENPAWYTAYTPYQPEISQGRLEALINFQTMVADLTGLPVAGASHARRGHRRRRGDDAAAPGEPREPTPSFVVDADTLPQTLAVLATRAEPLGIDCSSPTSTRPTDLPDGRVSSACCCPTRVRAAPCATSGRCSRPPTRRRLGRRRRRPAGAHAARAARRAGRRRRRRHHPALRRARSGSAARTPATSSVREGLARQLPGRLVGRLASTPTAVPR